MAVANSQKICVECKIDVSRQKRVKDARGNYFCVGCWEVRSASPKSHAANNSSPEISDLIALEETGTRKDDGCGSCAVCKSRVAIDHLLQHEGKPVCAACLSRAQATVAAKDSASTSGMKECPSCAERIQAKAKKCRYCGEMLSDGDGIIPLQDEHRLQPPMPSRGQAIFQPPPPYAQVSNTAQQQVHVNVSSTQARSSTSLIAAGYACALVSLLFCPPFFGVAGLVIGIINLTRGAVGHGIAQIVLSLVFTALGMLAGMAAMNM